ncbi:hypothetical protein QF025_002609 [Paraburkholderia graminis]|uniref:DUF6566 domain-containing protein n=2 Tax=Paraburkholderia graminis TaxID=60548 RepID=A0ABD5CF75_9BURK|nr:hypothetical protein [Paraburkholderia graminis]
MEDSQPTDLRPQKTEYRGYAISSTAQRNPSGQWVPCVVVTLRGRPISLNRERPDLAQPTREEAMCEALAWARHLIDQREIPLSEIGDTLLGERR